MDLIKEIPIEERPREKGVRYGVNALSNRELLAILIRTGIQGKSALHIADEILRVAGGLKGIGELTIVELQRIPGISKVKALEIKTCLEIARRVAYETCVTKSVLSSSKEVIHWLSLQLGSLQQEVFLVIFLDHACHLLSYETLFKGSINMSVVSPREVFREALLKNASYLILVHNHPSGNLTPSKEDIALTEKMVQLGQMMNVKILDHLIISKEGYFSMNASGIIEMEND